MHKLVFDEKAIAFLENLPKNISRRIYEKLEKTKENPRHYFDKQSM